MDQGWGESYNIEARPPQRLEDKTEMPPVLECSLELDYMFLILRVGLSKLVEHLDFFEPRFIPVQTRKLL